MNDEATKYELDPLLRAAQESVEKRLREALTRLRETEPQFVPCSMEGLRAQASFVLEAGLSHLGRLFEEGVLDDFTVTLKAPKPGRRELVSITLQPSDYPIHATTYSLTVEVSE